MNINLSKDNNRLALEKLNNYKNLFLVALFSYVLVYGFELTHFTLSIDEEFPDNFAQTIMLGRWGHALIRHYLLPEPFVPFITTALCLIFLSFAAVLSALYLKLSKYQSAAYIVMLAALPQLAYQIQFSNQSDTVALSILFSTLSLFTLDVSRLKSYVLFIILTIASLSVYQSVFLFAASLLCVKFTILAIRKEIRLPELVKTLAVYIALTLIALVINTLLSKLCAYYYHIPTSSYLTAMIGWGKLSPVDIILTVCHYIYNCFTLNAPFGMNALPFTLVWMLIISIIAFKKGRNYFLIMTLCLATIASCFIMNLVLGAWLPPRTMIQAPVIFAGLFAATLVSLKITSVPHKILLSVLPVFFLISGAVSSNKLFYSDYMAREADAHLSLQIIDTIYNKYPDFDIKKTPVFFYGSHTPVNSWRLAGADAFGASFFEWDGGNNSRIYAYLKSANIADFVHPDPGQVELASEIGKELPSWPNRGSVFLHNGVMIVKIGPQLSPYNK